MVVTHHVNREAFYNNKLIICTYECNHSICCEYVGQQTKLHEQGHIINEPHWNYDTESKQNVDELTLLIPTHMTKELYEEYHVGSAFTYLVDNYDNSRENQAPIPKYQFIQICVVIEFSTILLLCYNINIYIYFIFTNGYFHESIDAYHEYDDSGYEDEGGQKPPTLIEAVWQSQYPYSEVPLEQVHEGLFVGSFGFLLLGLPLLLVVPVDHIEFFFDLYDRIRNIQ